MGERAAETPAGTEEDDDEDEEEDEEDEVEEEVDDDESVELGPTTPSLTVLNIASASLTPPATVLGVAPAPLSVDVDDAVVLDDAVAAATAATEDAVFSEGKRPSCSASNAALGSGSAKRERIVWSSIFILTFCLGVRSACLNTATTARSTCPLSRSVSGAFRAGIVPEEEEEEEEEVEEVEDEVFGSVVLLLEIDAGGRAGKLPCVAAAALAAPAVVGVVVAEAVAVTGAAAAAEPLTRAVDVAAAAAAEATVGSIMSSGLGLLRNRGK